MPTTPQPSKAERHHERASAKQRVVRAFKEGRDWREVAKSNDVHYHTARRAILRADETPRKHGGVRPSRVKMTVDVMAKLEELVDEDCRMTLGDMCNRLRSDMQVDVSTSSVHRALQGMLYSLKKLCIEKTTMNNSVNKEKRKEFVAKLNVHIARGDMIIYHDETNFNLYLSRTEGRSRVGTRAKVALPPSQGKNLHVQGGVSPNSGILLLRTHDGSIQKPENARFLADLFTAALMSDEYRELEPDKSVVVVTDNAPAHSDAEELARDLLVADGILNEHKLVLLRLAPYSPMLNPIEGCWSVLKASMKRFMSVQKDELLVRGEYDTFVAHRLAIMKEAVASCQHVITPGLVRREERHCMRACFAAERGEDMQLGE